MKLMIIYNSNGYVYNPYIDSIILEFQHKYNIIIIHDNWLEKGINKYNVPQKNIYYLNDEVGKTRLNKILLNNNVFETVSIYFSENNELLTKLNEAQTFKLYIGSSTMSYNGYDIKQNDLIQKIKKITVDKDIKYIIEIASQGNNNKTDVVVNLQNSLNYYKKTTIEYQNRRIIQLISIYKRHYKIKGFIFLKKQVIKLIDTFILKEK